MLFEVIIIFALIIFLTSLYFIAVGFMRQLKGGNEQKEEG